jgi:hypothetical protein
MYLFQVKSAIWKLNFDGSFIRKISINIVIIIIIHIFIFLSSSSEHPTSRKKKYHIYIEQRHFSFHIRNSSYFARLVHTLRVYPFPPHHSSTLHNKRFINFHSDVFTCIFPFSMFHFAGYFYSLGDSC